MVFRSPFPDISLPGQPLSTLILERARARGAKPAYIDGLTGQTLTYAAFADAVQRTAAGVAARGLRKGEVCLIFSPNCLEWPVAFHAVVAAGGVVTTASPMLTAREVVSQARDAGATWLITHPAVLEPARMAAAAAGIERVIAFGPSHELPDGVVAFAELANAAADGPLVESDLDDVVLIPYSSGTTGYPKGVMITHRNLTANALQMLAATQMPEGARALAVLPFAHVIGTDAFLYMFPYNGMTTVVLPRFDLEQFLQAIESHRITHVIVAPPIVLALARHPLVERYDLSSLEAIICSAAPLKADLARTCAARIGCEVHQAFGMTELLAVSASPLGAGHPGSAGVPIPNTEFRVVDPLTGADLGPDEPGELWVRGPQVMQGYLNRPDATAELITVDGWLRTGDIGYVDQDGFIYVVDRLKELIKYKGYQVAPAELEDILSAHPAIADAAVIGRPDESSGEIPTAYVVRSGDLSAAEIMDYVAGRVAPYKKIRAVEFVDSIPRSPVGKVLRRVLVEQERGLVSA